MITDKIIERIDQERRAQDIQWGGPIHDDSHLTRDWFYYIEAQCNSAIQEIRLAKDKEDIQDRFIKIAALAIAGYESQERLK
jgi:hypothetical protein